MDQRLVQMLHTLESASLMRMIRAQNAQSSVRMDLIKTDPAVQRVNVWSLARELIVMLEGNARR